MEKDIKKALYENIMSSVAKEVKKVLNESDELADKQSGLKDLKQEYASLTSKIDDMWVEYSQKMVITTDADAQREISNNFYKSLEPLKIALRNKTKEIYNLTDEINELKQTGSQSESSKKPNYSYDNNYEDEGGEYDEEEHNGKNTNSPIGNNKFVMEVISKDYICNGEGYWDKEDWDDLVKDKQILCYIYDADETPIPDFSPDWLYEILEKYENIPGGYCSEDMESTFIVSKETYDALLKDPHCVNADDYTECGYNYNNDENEYNNDDDEIKEKISNIILNPDFKVKAGGRFAPKGGKAKLDLLDENYEKNIYLHIMLQDDPKLAQVRKDIKYDVNFENVSLDHKGTTKSGIDYLALLVNGDWEEPVAVFVYWDGKKYRGYVPTRGNAINTINKSAFGNDEDVDNEYCTKYLGLKDYYGCDGCAFGLPINWGACLEEFETRLVVKQ